jgi:hypothetical protein
MRQRRAPESGSRAAGGGTTMSRATEEREHLAVSKNYKVWQERARGLKF